MLHTCVSKYNIYFIYMYFAVCMWPEVDGLTAGAGLKFSVPLLVVAVEAVHSLVTSRGLVSDAGRLSGMQFAALPLEHGPFPSSLSYVSSTHNLFVLVPSLSVLERNFFLLLVISPKKPGQKAVWFWYISIQSSLGLTRKCPSVISSVMFYDFLLNKLSIQFLMSISLDLLYCK